MVRRISHPGKPIVLIDEGPGLALRHRYDELRKQLDVALTDPPRKGPRETLHTDLGQPWRTAA